MISKLDPTRRFTERVDYYVKYRPGYSQHMMTFFAKEMHLESHDVIADIGSGTGMLSLVFLENGNQVFGVEPNEAMRRAGEAFLLPFERFVSIAATAEQTTLKSRSVDMITVGSAFHWFDPLPTKLEFKRILKPEGWVVITGNSRKQDVDCASRELDLLMERYTIDENAAKLHKKEVRFGRIEEFFGAGSALSQSFDHTVSFDLEGLVGYVLSHSSAPLEHHDCFAAMKKELEGFFHVHQKMGQVEVAFVTQLHYGKI